MTEKIEDIIKTNFHKVDILDSIKKVIDLSIAVNQDCLPVFENGNLAGIITSSELMDAHPNRIVADAMSDHYFTIPATASIWYAKEIFDNNDNVNTLLVMEGKELIGLVDRTALYAETGKYIDLLTGLYKSSYLYYKAEDLINKGHEISIIFIDVNNFGDINKDYGHVVGDTVLKEIALVLKNNTPDDVFLCRYAGDEFSLLTTYEDSECENFASNLQKMILTNTYTNNIKTSIAVGIAGGMRSKKKPQNPHSTVLNLVNLASLASTKAKKNERKLYMESYTDVEVIA